MEKRKRASRVDASNHLVGVTLGLASCDEGDGQSTWVRAGAIKGQARRGMTSLFFFVVLGLLDQTAFQHWTFWDNLRSSHHRPREGPP